MATQALASMLDELMGKHRNALPSEKPPDIGFEDPEVCKYYLAGYCHHELFNNTKADLGPCGKTHDEKLRDDYRASPKFERLGYEDEWLAALQRVHNDMQRKITRNKQRLALTQPGAKDEDGSKEKTETKIDSLSEKITALLQQAETLGAQGRVEDAQKLIEKAEELKEERNDCRKVFDPMIPELKTMEVCDTCACFLIIGDSQFRIDEHLTGKQHLGFAKIKATMDELIRRKEEKRRNKEMDVRKDIEEREKRSRDRSDSRRFSRSYRSRSRSPGRLSNGSYRKSGDVQGHRHGDNRRHHRQMSKYDSPGSCDNYKRHSAPSSSSRYSNSDQRRHSSYRRSRSPRHSRKSPRQDDERRKKSRDCEIGCSSTSINLKVNGSSSDRPPSADYPDPKAIKDEEEEEEGLIDSSDE